MFTLKIIEDTLLKAKNEGIASYQKSNKEIAVAFRPDFFIQYIENLEEFHSLEPIEEIYDDSENEVLEYRYQITSYGADYPVDALIKRINENVIFVPPFQRNYARLRRPRSPMPGCGIATARWISQQSATELCRPALVTPCRS